MMSSLEFAHEQIRIYARLYVLYLVMPHKSIQITIQLK